MLRGPLAAALAAAAALTAAAPDTRPPSRALWHWHTTAHLEDPARWAEFLEFCRRERIGRVWMQLPGGTPAERIPAATASRLRARLAAAHRAGVAVEALDGAPELGLREHHAEALAIVDAVIAFNRGGTPEERFAGVHFDNEIYLLPGWSSEPLQAGMRADLGALNREAQRRVRAAGGLTYGVDVPFWWPDVRTEVETLDAVGIMDYRDRAQGPDGIVALAAPILAHADAHGRARVHVGVETFLQPPAPVWFVAGLPRAAFDDAAAGPARELVRRSRLDGFRLRALDDGRRVHPGLELPPSPTSGDEERAGRALATLAAALGDPAAGPDVVTAGLAATAAPGSELAPGGPRAFGTPETPVAGFTATAVMPPKITFADEDAAHLRRELAAADEALRRYRSFAGIALHYYEPYRAKVDPRGVP